LRAKPEPTQLECLSDASFLGKLLVLPTNVRLAKKFLPGANTLAYLATSLAMKKKSFLTLTPGGNSSHNSIALVNAQIGKTY